MVTTSYLYPFEVKTPIMFSCVKFYICIPLIPVKFKSWKRNYTFNLQSECKIKCVILSYRHRKWRLRKEWLNNHCEVITYIIHSRLDQFLHAVLISYHHLFQLFLSGAVSREACTLTQGSINENKSVNTLNPLQIIKSWISSFLWTIATLKKRNNVKRK